EGGTNAIEEGASSNAVKEGGSNTIEEGASSNAVKEGDSVNEYGKPNGKFENLQVCLESLWCYIGEKGHMNRLIMPVLGSGKTGINTSRIKILKEIIFSFVAMTREQKITEELVICIHPSDISNNNLDIYELIDYLRCQCKYEYKFINSTTSKEIN
ncbi:hypothetical protein THERMOT_839, partial [Bathymodiolus thermophilus thioautotrophic gill symbiont]|uniref:macro domain-containing protein n=1 Tax=Bathymodiolus thermophilus thioautotrophic gill symbiont TaxID=2360 RepID=UPI00192B32C1